MFNSETLEVAIGMVFLFLLMALICTAIKEWIEGLLKWRAMDLERALRNLLDDDTGETSAALYRHPGIFALFQGTYKAEKLASSWFSMWTGATRHMPLSGRRNLPSYIPTAHFATAFIDHIARGRAIFPRKTTPARTGLAAALQAGWTAFRGALRPTPSQPATNPLGPATATDAGQGDTAHVALTVDVLREKAALQPPYLRQLMYSVIDYADGDLGRVRKQIEQWFDGAMDRASGWYKRRTQALLFIIGILSAVVLNVDSLHILHRLTMDKTLRESVLQHAEAAKAPAAGASATASTDALAALKQTRNELDSVALPIGWEHDEDHTAWYAVSPTQFCAADSIDGNGTVKRKCMPSLATTYAWIRIVLGWLITALAIMLGAPFWFDVLNKIMIIRSTVKPHEKSPEEPSQDGGDGKTNRLLVSVAPSAQGGPAGDGAK